jgi:eukaryotic translation initiation factor 2C
MGWKLMLNVDSAATAFYTEQTVFDFMCTVLRRRDTANTLTDADRQPFMGRELKDFERKQFSREIKGLRVVCTHLSYPRKYRVNDLTRLSAKKQTFPLSDGSLCSVEKYFRDTYPNSRITNPHLPCLHVGPKDRNVYLPIDVCNIVGGQKCVKKLTDIQTANMIRHTAKPAYKRERDIRETVKRAEFNRDRVAREFGIEVSSRMTEVGSRVLSPPKLKYSQGSSVTPREGAGAWDMRGGKRFYHGIEVKKWAVVVCTYRHCNHRPLVEGLVRQSREMGMSMTPDPRVEDLGKRSLAKVFHGLLDSHGGKLDLILVIIDRGGPHYNEVKRLGDTAGGLNVATQCVLSNTVEKKCNQATLGNICLKINARLGGINSVIDPDTLPSIVRRMPIIIFGADVTHPRSDDTTSPSIASVVASVDLEGSRYRALHRNQKHRQEIIADLKVMAKEHLMEFKRQTRMKPVKIIFYRDGVSGGQFDAVRLEEIGALQAACKELEADYQPKITFIVVQKRHHTRFFPMSEHDQVGKGKNVPPGTTVDTVITHPKEHDFYLCSHAAIQGTSRPCHYHVIWDDSDFGADDLQLFTYQLCHMFWRCNRSVSYPAPTYYAHRDAAHAKVLLQALGDNSR